MRCSGPDCSSDAKRWPAPPGGQSTDPNPPHGVRHKPRLLDVDRALPAKQAGEKTKRQPTGNRPAPTQANVEVDDARERQPEDDQPETVRHRGARVRGKHEKTEAVRRLVDRGLESGAKKSGKHGR